MQMAASRSKGLETQKQRDLEMLLIVVVKIVSYICLIEWKTLTTLPSSFLIPSKLVKAFCVLLK